MDNNNFVFRIPDRFEELENQDDFGNFYIVNSSAIGNPLELSNRIKEAEYLFKNNGTNFIFETFDYFYFIIKHSKSIEENVRKEAWVLLNRAMMALCSELKKFIEKDFHLNLRKFYQNKLQMIVYPLILLSETYEEAEISSADIENQNVRKKKSKAPCIIYQDTKGQMISTLLNLFSLRLNRIFDPRHFLDNFVNVITRWIYKIVEHSTASRLRSSSYFQNLCEIITIALDKYQHSQNYCMKIFEILQNKESASNQLSDLVSYNLKNLPFLIYDIIDRIKSFDITILSRDSSGPRAIAQFLIDLGSKSTDVMFKNISGLFEFLDQDSYLLRNATLEIISTIIIKKFKSPCIIKDIHIKHKLLDKLEEHIHDKTSYTRSRALQLWCKMIEENAIPIDRLPQITEMVVGRLEDKSCFVRKYAVQFLTLLLKDNPFSLMRKQDIVKTLEKIESKRDRYIQELKEMIDKFESQIQQFMDNTSDEISDGTTNEDLANRSSVDTSLTAKKRKSDSFEEIGTKRYKINIDHFRDLAIVWHGLDKQFYDFCKRHRQELKDKLYQNLVFPEDLPQDDLNKGLEYFRQLVLEKQFEKSLVALFSLKSLFPNEKMFKLKKIACSDSSDDEEENEENVTSSQESNDYLNSFDDIFISSITDFSSKFMEKTYYEHQLARNVFLAPLINFGNLHLEPDDEGKEKEQEFLKEMISKEIIEKQETISSKELSVKRLNMLIERFRLALCVIQAISNSMPIICPMLDSRNITDIQEAIVFFTQVYKEMDSDKAIVGIQKMLKLIFTKEKTIRDVLLDAFTEIYLKNRDHSENQDEQSVKSLHYSEVKNLSNMILKLNQGELVCARTLIKELYQAQRFNQTHLQILWEIYAMKYSNVNEEDSRVALIIIGMLASAQRSLIQKESNLQNIISISFEARRNNYRFVADSCDVLLKAFELPQMDQFEKFYKLPQDHILFDRLHSIIVDSITNVDYEENNNRYWPQMSSNIIKVIYFLAEKPDLIISNITRDCYLKILEISEIHNSFVNPESSSSQSCLVSKSSQNQKLDWFMFGRVDDSILSRFISILGDIAVNLLIHLDFHLLKEFKIRQLIKEKNANKPLQLLKGNSRNSIRSSRSSLSTNNMEDEDDSIIGPSSNDDPYQDNINKICNEAVLFDKGILTKFCSYIERIAVDYEGSRFSYCLRQSASLTMAKFMLLSLNYTRQNRSILADILEKSKDRAIRTNAIVSFGDLLVRFPNEVEHFTGKIFGCLLDNDLQVKRNALKVLTRLILADMVKPKGHISKISQLITDDDQLISSSAKLFFVELGKKNNANIYNFLPDIISNLSGPNGMEENKFQEMIRFLFELLEKTRNTESLIGKLCQRFKNTTAERTWSDISFCLSQLQYNDRALFTLMSNFGLFAETLTCDQVYGNICSIVNNARKAGSLKQEIKSLLDEMENRINEVRTKGLSLNGEENDKNNGNISNNVNEEHEQPVMKQKDEYSFQSDRSVRKTNKKQKLNPPSTQKFVRRTEKTRRKL